MIYFSECNLILVVLVCKDSKAFTVVYIELKNLDLSPSVHNSALCLSDFVPVFLSVFPPLTPTPLPPIQTLCTNSDCLDWRRAKLLSVSSVTAQLSLR